MEREKEVLAPVVNYRRIYPPMERESPPYGWRFRFVARGLDYSPWRYCHTTWLVLIFFGEHDGWRRREMGRKGNWGLLNVFPLSKPPSLSFSVSPFPLLLSPFLAFPSPLSNALSFSTALYISLSAQRVAA